MIFFGKMDCSYKTVSLPGIFGFDFCALCISVGAHSAVTWSTRVSFSKLFC